MFTTTWQLIKWFIIVIKYEGASHEQEQEVIFLKKATLLLQKSIIFAHVHTHTWHGGAWVIVCAVP